MCVCVCVCFFVYCCLLLLNQPPKKTTIPPKKIQTGHKIYAPKGVGALFVKESLKKNLQSFMKGAGQEQGFRAGFP